MIDGRSLEKARSRTRLMDHDRNLLFGVLALQADLIDTAQFAEACSAWAARKDVPLADLLAERGWLTAEERANVEFLVARKLRRHQGDAGASLAAVADDSVRRVLAVLDDPDISRSLADLPQHGGHVLLSTVVTQPEARERYTLTRLHATGGIGQVWLARDQDLGREVALKELRPERAAHPTAWARFLEEAQITGQLEHPGIVPVYELARRSGEQQPFYTMRFVKGRTLREAAAAYHARRQQNEAGPLELRELLTAFVGVCNAVAYAHSRGVLHRDLKPQNVVLGDYGEVLVLDWGLAKRVGQPEGEAPPVAVADAARAETVQGQVLGTPAYMAPEQAAGRPDLLDRRTDVYGLGAILYEILAGRPPFTGADTQEVLKKVCEQEPARPRQLVPSVPAALEAVCRQALAKRREDRYATATELAEEVRRWLADEPVRAYPEPLAQRLGRWGRRHRAAVGTAGALLLTAVLALAVGLWAVNAERQRTRQALEGERQARAEEGRRRKQAREALDTMSSQVIDDWLTSQKKVTGPQKQFLQRALASYEEFAQDTGQDESARAGVAKAYLRVGSIRHRLGQREEAGEAYHAAVERYGRLAADYPAAPEHRRDLARSHNSLGILLQDTGRDREAGEEYRAARELQQRLADVYPDVPAYRQELASSHNNLGNLLNDAGRLPEAEAEYRAALALLQRLAEEHPAAPEHRKSLALAHNNLATLFQATGQPRAAEAEYRAALALYRRLADDHPDVPDYRWELARSHSNLGAFLKDTGRAAAAQAEYRAALALQQRMADDHPAVPEYRQGLASSHNNLGALFKDTGHPGEAEPEYRTALALQRRLADDHPAVPEYRQQLARTHNNLGLLLADTGHPREAETEYRAALALRQKLADDHPAVPGYREDLAASHNSLASLLGDTGRAPEAEAEYRAAVALRQRLAEEQPAVPEYRQGLAMSQQNLDNLLKRTGRAREAEAAYRAALALQMRLAEDHPAVPEYRQNLANTHSNLGLLLQDTGRAREAEAGYRQSVALRQRLVEEHPAVPDYRQDLANSHNNLGTLLKDAGRVPEAEAEYQAALALYRRQVEKHPALPDYRNTLTAALGNLARLRLGQQDYAGARRLLEEGLPHHQAALKANPRHPRYRLFFRNDLQSLAEAQVHLGAYAEAAAAADRLAENAVEPPKDLYNAACCLSRCAPLAAKDEKLPEARRRELAKEYADRALARLRQALGKGFRDAALMRKDPDLDPLRQRDDFKELLADLEK
jgi:serine/threonine-protein kinase